MISLMFAFESETAIAMRGTTSWCRTFFVPEIHLVPRFLVTPSLTAILFAVEGKIAIVMRGKNSFMAKVLIAQRAKAAAVVIVNSDDDLIVPGSSPSGDEQVAIPVVLVCKRDSNKIIPQNGEAVHIAFGTKKEDNGQTLKERGGFLDGPGNEAVEALPLVQVKTPLLPGETISELSLITKTR